MIEIIHQASSRPFNSERLLDSFNIVITSYGFIINFFPIYSSMHSPRTNRGGIFAVIMALIFCFTTYTLFSLMAMFSYGIDIQPNIFENIKQDKGVISICLRCLF